MTDDAEERSHEWSRDTQKIVVLSWISFLVAGVFSMLFFAFIDPLVLIDALDMDLIDERNTGYALGFFFFWANGWVAGWYTLRLVRRKRRGPAAGEYPGAGTR